MKTKKLHKWNLSCAEARELQLRLARRVRFTAIRKEPGIAAGLDCAFSKDGRQILAVVVVIKLADFLVVETAIATQNVDFPYVPGLLSFREAPVCLAAVEKLKVKPNVFIIDGQGIAHPRRFGLASHIGVLIDKPTIGCAKSRLTGSFKEPGTNKGYYSNLIDKNEVIGIVLRTRTNVKPVFVSVGHKCTLEDARRITLACTSKYRLPEPTRLAHQLVGKAKYKT